MRSRFLLAMSILLFTYAALAQTGTMTVVAGINTVQGDTNPTAAPDPTIAVGKLDFCEHVNSAYQCWYKSGANAFKPVNFLGNTNPKSDSTPWSQHSNNSGNTPNCPSTSSPDRKSVV